MGRGGNSVWLHDHVQIEPFLLKETGNDTLAKFSECNFTWQWSNMVIAKGVSRVMAVTKKIALTLVRFSVQVTLFASQPKGGCPRLEHNLGGNCIPWGDLTA